MNGQVTTVAEVDGGVEGGAVLRHRGSVRCAGAGQGEPWPILCWLGGRCSAYTARFLNPTSRLWPRAHGWERCGCGRPVSGRPLDVVHEEPSTDPNPLVQVVPLFSQGSVTVDVRVPAAVQGIDRKERIRWHGRALAAFMIRL